MAVETLPQQSLTSYEVGVTTSSDSITPENSFTGELSVLRTDPRWFYGGVARGKTFEEALEDARKQIDSSVRASRKLNSQDPRYWLYPTDFQIRFPNDLPPADPKVARYPDRACNGTVVINFDKGTRTIVPFEEESVSAT